mgnify:FL=1
MHIACGISQISQGWRIICRFLRHKELRHIYAFERQELHLLVDAVGVACETAACADDAVAGDDDGDGVVRDGAADGVGGFFHADAAGDFAVGYRFAVGDREQDVPDFLTKRCGFRCERRQKVGLLPAEVKVEPAACLLEYREAFLLVLLFERGGEVFLPVKPKADERRAVAGEGHGAEWRVVMRCVLHGEASFRMVKLSDILMQLSSTIIKQG